MFSFAPRSRKQVVADALCVLDTNTLLVPYGTDPSSLEAIRNTYQRLLKDDRLRVPAHVAREFAKNRPERLKAVYDQLAKRQSVEYSRIQYPLLLAELSEFKLLTEAEAEFQSKLKAYQAATKTLLDRVRLWNWDDPVSLMYRDMFNGNVIVDLKLSSDDLSKDFAFRHLHKVPPGYKDGDKDINASGDLIIWKTILEIGRKEKKDLILVSGDEKSDWWYRASEGALYPRFELLDEYRRLSDGKTFHIFALADLLKELGVKQEVVDAVREEEASFKPISLPSRAAWAPNAINAVVMWLQKTGGSVLDDPGSGYVKWRRKDDSPVVNVEIRLVHNEQRAAAKIEHALTNARNRKAHPYRLVLVARFKPDADRLMPGITAQLQSRTVSLPSAEVFLGYLEDDRTFHVLASIGPDL